LKAKYLQINKCFIIFAFENQLALYGLAGLADEFCERGDSLKTYWKESSNVMKIEIPE